MQSLLFQQFGREKALLDLKLHVLQLKIHKIEGALQHKIAPLNVGVKEIIHCRKMCQAQMLVSSISSTSTMAERSSSIHSSLETWLGCVVKADEKEEAKGMRKKKDILSTCERLFKQHRVY